MHPFLDFLSRKLCPQDAELPHSAPIAGIQQLYFNLELGATNNKTYLASMPK